MLVIDSSAWIEWLANTPTASSLIPHMTSPDEIIVPTIVQFEVFKWLWRERGQSVAESFLGLTMQECAVISLTTKIAVAAVGASRAHQLAVADSIILATAQVETVDLLTTDVRFEGLPGVIYVPKAPT